MRPTALVILGLSVLSGCTTPLELRNIMEFKAEPDTEATALTISGTSAGSALVITGIRTRRAGRDLLVDVRTGLVGGDSGTFTKTLKLAPDVDRVLLGRDRQEIWRRNAGT